MPLNKAVDDLRREIGHVWKLPTSKDDFHYIVSEVGELADALMRLPGYPDIPPTRRHPRTATLEDVAEEAADVLIMLTSLCDCLGIDLLEAFHSKLLSIEQHYSTTEDSLDNSDIDDNIRDAAEHAGVPLRRSMCHWGAGGGRTIPSVQFDTDEEVGL